MTDEVGVLGRGGAGDVRTPFLFQCRGCVNLAVTLTNVVLKDSPMWTMHPYNCSYVTIRNVTVDAPIESPNTDGIDPDSCNNVLIENCTLGCGDDQVSVKASTGIPSYNVLVRNTTFLWGQA